MRDNGDETSVNGMGAVSAWRSKPQEVSADVLKQMKALVDQLSFVAVVATSLVPHGVFGWWLSELLASFCRRQKLSLEK